MFSPSFLPSSCLTILPEVIATPTGVVHPVAAEGSEEIVERMIVIDASESSISEVLGHPGLTSAKRKTRRGRGRN
ncbi:hypothetical protein FRB94_014697 [Tulasnella sp. JGI-2019a]|nr:hypothetical protein FRB94_014697 [Tulasnella sp. JGI-2019a]KAG9027359.1 hypothetical protein FRB95_007820 [Tulasnella sp. JGI-2019a]